MTIYCGPAAGAPTTGQVVIVLTNNSGSAALNGTVYIEATVQG